MSFFFHFSLTGCKNLITQEKLDRFLATAPFFHSIYLWYPAPPENKDENTDSPPSLAAPQPPSLAAPNQVAPFAVDLAREVTTPSILRRVRGTPPQPLQPRSPSTPPFQGCRLVKSKQQGPRLVQASTKTLPPLQFSWDMKRSTDHGRLIKHM